MLYVDKLYSLHMNVRLSQKVFAANSFLHFFVGHWTEKIVQMASGCALQRRWVHPKNSGDDAWCEESRQNVAGKSQGL